MDTQKYNEWECNIGIETHAQIKSKSKLFSRSSTDGLNLEPNSCVDILDAAEPGTLPMLNEFCVIQAIKAGHTVQGTINLFSAFDRKNYFYADLPKGYQISQYYFPIVQGGYIEINNKNGLKKINLDRIHIEEDAGKNIHEKQTSLIDLNRAGVGLLEIVSKPDISSAEEAVEYVKNLRKRLMFAGINDGDLENGSFRCDVNISIKKRGETKLGTRREIKNLNSFSSLVKAIEYEIEYQVKTLEGGGKIEQDTLLFDIDTNQTKIMRSKENANDYRYFADPDLPPLILTQEFIDQIGNQMPEMPDIKKEKYIKNFNLSEYDAEILTSSPEVAKFFEEVAVVCSPKLAANWIITEVFAMLKIHNETINTTKFTAQFLIEILDMIQKEIISGKLAKDIFKIAFEENKSPNLIAKERNLLQISDQNVIENIIKEFLSANSDNVALYKQGNTKLFGFFVGEIIKISSGKANPKMVNQILKELLG